jgi:O-antigen ligase
LDITEQLRPSSRHSFGDEALWSVRLPSLTWSGPRVTPRFATAVAVFLATLLVVATNEHDPDDVQAGLVAQGVIRCVPLLAAAVAALAVVRPWQGYLAILLLTPVWNTGQVSWHVGTVEILMQTIFIVALGVGCLVRSLSAPSSERGGRGWAARLRSYGVGGLATLAVLAVAGVSTALSPDFGGSLSVLMHGIVEPVAMGVLLLALVPNRRGLMHLVAVLGVSVALGCLLNLAQVLPSVGSIDAFHGDRIYLSRTTYFNIGLFGELLAMAVPLLIGCFALWRRSGDRRLVALLLAALAISCGGLFLAMEKSAVLAAAAGTVGLLILLATTWRRRVAIVLAALALSVTVVPWPAYLLRDVAPVVADPYQRVAVAVLGPGRFDSWNPTTLAGRHSLVERYFATEAALHMAADHPVFGIGLDQFGAQYVSGYRPTQAELGLDSAHAFWPEIAAELGLLALILVLVIFGSAMLGLWRVYRAPPDHSTRVLAATLLASLVAWLVVATAFAGDLYRAWRHMSSDIVMVAVLVAAAMALSRIVGESRETRRAPCPAPRP